MTEQLPQYMYEKQTRGGGLMYIIYHQESDGIDSIGSLILNEDQEPLIVEFVKKLNDWNNPTQRRTREGVSRTQE